MDWYENPATYILAAVAAFMITDIILDRIRAKREKNGSLET